MSSDTVLDVCVIGFGGEFDVEAVNNSSDILSTAIGALYAYTLDKTNKVRITAVCRSVKMTW